MFASQDSHDLLPWGDPYILYLASRNQAELRAEAEREAAEQREPSAPPVYVIDQREEVFSP